MVKSCNICSNKKCIIKLCSNESKQLIDLSKVVFPLKKNQFLFREGNSVDGIYILFSGKLKVFTTGYNDKIQTIRLAREGNLIGHRGIGDKHYTISASTLQDSVICFVEKKIFYSILKSDINLTYHLMLFYAEELRTAELRMKTLSQMTVREKVVEALLLVAKAFGVFRDKKIVIDAVLSRKDYAEIAGINHEQFTRILSELKSDHLIKTDKRHIIIINPPEFEKVISSYYSRYESLF